MVKELDYDNLKQSLCGDITVELDSTEQIFSLYSSNQLLMIKTKPIVSPWTSTGSRLELSLKEHKISWFVPIEASYT